MDNDKIREACAQLADAIQGNEGERAKALSIDLLANVLCNLNDIPYLLNELITELRNK